MTPKESLHAALEEVLTGIERGTTIYRAQEAYLRLLDLTDRDLKAELVARGVFSLLDTIHTKEPEDQYRVMGFVAGAVYQKLREFES